MLGFGCRLVDVASRYATGWSEAWSSWVNFFGGKEVAKRYMFDVFRPFEYSSLKVVFGDDHPVPGSVLRSPSCLVLWNLS